MMIFAIIFLVLGIFFIIQYNLLIKNRMLVQEAKSGIDVQLKRRYDLIPKLVDTVQGYKEYEGSLLKNIAKIRTSLLESKDIKENISNENELSRSLKNIFAVAENYPDLKANQNFLQLQSSLSEIEDQLQMARRYYNGTVRDYNVSTQVFPSNIVANLFNFKEESFFDIEYATQRPSPDIKF